MKKLILRSGLPLMTVGCLMLASSYPTGMNNSNWYLLLSLALVVSGAVLYVVASKRKSRY